MRKALFLSLFFVSSAIAGFAQDKQAAKPSAQAVNDANSPQANIQKNAVEETAKLDKLVRLTDDQKQKIHNVNIQLEQRKSMVNKADESSRGRILEELERARTQMYMQVLSPEQAKLYKQSLAADK